MIISIFIVSYNYDKNMTKCDYLQKKTIHTAKYEWSYAYSLLLPQAGIVILGIQASAKPTTVEHVVNDIIPALLANGFVVIHFC